uniref:Uncharacterized protein n=1 Tax=Chelydra serpentina TaxID=8475 RepID=A0A8C3S2B6_CHESE
IGNTTSCCVSSSTKLGTNAHSQLDSYHPKPTLSHEDMGCNLQHISNWENRDGKRVPAQGELGKSPYSFPRARKIYATSNNRSIPREMQPP